MQFPTFYNPKFKTYHKKYFDSILKQLNLKVTDYCELTRIPYSTIQNARAKSRVSAYYIVVLHNALLFHYFNDMNEKVAILNKIFELKTDE